MTFEFDKSDKQSVETILPDIITHKYMNFPNGDVQITLHGEDLSFILSMLDKINYAYELESLDKKASEAQKQRALLVKEESEMVYKRIIDNLKCSKANSKDAN